ncbi:MAG: hypothetical protein J5641_02045 [Bacteroidales bacterium]|nr:hypothetical protein [Bacteroidales bacterium]
MGLLDKLLGNKNIIQQVSALAGNANITEILKSLTGNKEFMTNLSNAKSESELQSLISNAIDAFKDKKLTDAEKKELTNQLKHMASGLLGKK